MRRCLHLLFGLVPMLTAFSAPVSFRRDVQPILRASCVACHKPSKDRGDLDVTTYSALMKGGKHGQAVVIGSPDKSRLIRDVSGGEPAMPEEGEPLTAAEVEVLRRWIAEGARDDTQSAMAAESRATPVYERLPSVSALAWSPSGDLLAAAAHREILVFEGDSERPAHRWSGDALRIESIAFSSSGRFLAAAGGSPSEFGEIQIWDVAQGKMVRSIRTTNDLVHGIAFSDDESKVAVGCTDKLVRVFSVDTGEERMRCDNHIDWVLATAFTHDGNRVVSASRDRALKLIDVATGHLIDDVALPRGPLVSLARHPKEDLVVSGGVEGQVILSRMEGRGGRLAEGDNKEMSFVREMPRGNGSVSALAFSADGKWLAATTIRGDCRVMSVQEGKVVREVKVGTEALFAVSFHPQNGDLAVAGMDGVIRIFDAKEGRQKRAWGCVPLGR
jgi:WD40 repeat protein